LKQPKVKFDHVTKDFKLYKKQFDKILDVITLNKQSKSFYAINDVSFEVFSGESIGVVGVNGAGKSTLSNLLAQVIEPKSGKVEIEGEASLIAISAGLNNNLTGIENIEMKCLMLGIKPDTIKKIIPEIEQFADIGDFIHQPVKNYSSGMKSRLGFSISVHTNPDILIVDEALSVGDSTFYDKCLNKINEFKVQGKTIFFVSHSIGQIRSFSDRVMWLHFGELKEFGEPGEVLENYKNFIGWFNELSVEEQKEYKAQYVKKQYKDKKEHTRSGKKPSLLKKIKNIAVSVVILFIFSLLAFSVVNPSYVESYIGSLSNSNVNPPTSKKSEDKESTKDLAVKIDQPGIIITDNATIYKSAETEEEIGELAYNSELTIKNKVNKFYQVSYEDGQGVIKVEDALIMDPDKIGKINFNDLLEGFPTIFSESNNYYLAHLDMSYEEVKGKLLAMTDEKVDANGKKVLEYGYDDVSYRFNKRDRSEAITVYNIDSDNPSLKDILEKTKAVDEAEKVFVFYTKTYLIQLDLNKDQAIIQFRE
jgi:teichoic acid transport system ATP-binding protein